MNVLELAQRIKLHPRASLVCGILDVRPKLKGALQGHVPHYARAGCSVVQFVGDNALEEPSAAEVEFNLQESGFPLPSAYQSYFPRTLLCQLKFGRQGGPATQAAYRVLRELGTVIASSVKKEVYLAAIPILTPGAMGSQNGVFFPIGLFNSAGTALWLHPDAVGVMLQAEYPKEQKERSTAGATGAPAHAAGTVAGWYSSMAYAMAEAGLKGQALHDAVLKLRARQLLEQGTVPNLDAGMAAAKLEAPGAHSAQEAPEAKAAAKTSVRQQGARLRGRKA